MRVIGFVAYPFRYFLIFLVRIYKWCISPLLPKTCRFYPSCSTYMILALKEWGIVKGLMLGIKRILRCRPRGGFGEDYLPLNIKGDLRWTF